MDEQSVKIALQAKECPFCSSALELVPDLSQHIDKNDGGRLAWWRESVEVHACPLCGWWKVESCENIQADHSGLARWYKLEGAAATLATFDHRDASVPIEVVREYLVGRYNDRFTVHPRVFEEIVASVFRDLGYYARATAYSADDGIDVVLENAAGQQVGVQVKRYRNSIKVEAIRSLVGALVIGGFTEGMFVTTSSFQAGADRTTSLAALRGFRIDLWNADRFFSALEIAQRAKYRDRADFVQSLGDVRSRMKVLVFENTMTDN